MIPRRSVQTHGSTLLTRHGDHFLRRTVSPSRSCGKPEATTYLGRGAGREAGADRRSAGPLLAGPADAEAGLPGAREADHPERYDHHGDPHTGRASAIPGQHRADGGTRDVRAPVR